MKKTITLIAILLCSLGSSFCQEVENLEKQIAERQKLIEQQAKDQKAAKEKLDSLKAVSKADRDKMLKQLKEEKEKIEGKISEIGEDESTSKNSRISFILGIGTSWVWKQDLYQNPAVNLSSNNSVVIEKSQNVKTNLSLGIVYTPYIRTIYSPNGKPETMPHGISFAAFINPVTLSKATENQSFFNMTDWGIGIGKKFAAPVMIMLTVEWLSVRQPKDWFINTYKGNDKAYVINSSPQLSFDINDNNIFRTKIATTFGFKACFSFDIVKNFRNSSN